MNSATAVLTNQKINHSLHYFIRSPSLHLTVNEWRQRPCQKKRKNKIVCPCACRSFNRKIIIPILNFQLRRPMGKRKRTRERENHALRAELTFPLIAICIHPLPVSFFSKSFYILLDCGISIIINIIQFFTQTNRTDKLRVFECGPVLRVLFQDSLVRLIVWLVTILTQTFAINQSIEWLNTVINSNQ